jgi:hypothetical protein
MSLFRPVGVQDDIHEVAALETVTYRSRTSALTLPKVVSGLGAMPSVNAARMRRLKSGRGCSAVMAARSVSLMS